MKKVTRKITVDLSRRSNSRILFATQNDLYSRRLLIKLTDDGMPYPVQHGLTVTVNYLRPDGVSGAYLADVCEDGSVEYVISPAILNAAGQTQCTVSLFNEDGNKLTSSPFIIDVAESLYLGNDVSEDEGEDLISSIMSAYTSMDSAENAREWAEAERERAEEQRKIADEERVSAELGRANAEEKRQEYYSKIEPNLRAIADIQQGFINENGDGEGGAFVSLLQAYPIGSIYMSVNATDPATLFGGEWERIKDTFLLSAGDTYGAGTSGGSADAVLIEHTHDITSYQGNPTYLKSGSDASGVLVVHDSVDYVTNGASSAHKLNARHAGKGGGQGKNMPPYLAVYVWKRVG